MQFRFDNLVLRPKLPFICFNFAHIGVLWNVLFFAPILRYNKASWESCWIFCLGLAQPDILGYSMQWIKGETFLLFVLKNIWGCKFDQAELKRIIEESCFKQLFPFQMLTGNEVGVWLIIFRIQNIYIMKDTHNRHSYPLCLLFNYLPVSPFPFMLFRCGNAVLNFRLELHYHVLVYTCINSARG